MVDKVNNKINNIKNIITKIKDEVVKNIQSLFDIIIRSQDDPQLRQTDLNKIDDALNFVWNKICKKNKIKTLIDMQEINQIC